MTNYQFVVGLLSAKPKGVSPIYNRYPGAVQEAVLDWALVEGRVRGMGGIYFFGWIWGLIGCG